MSEHFNPKAIMHRVIQAASEERKIIGGSYEVTFYFQPLQDYLVFTASGLIQARGRDTYHVYIKPWEKSVFASLSCPEVLEKFSSKIESVEIKACGMPYHKVFASYDAFLNWLGFPQQLDLLSQSG